MSTTTNRDVAVGYAGGLDASGAGSTPMIFEFGQGMVNRGAELEWLSQYPGENEGAHSLHQLSRRDLVSIEQH